MSITISSKTVSEYLSTLQENSTVNLKHGNYCYCCRAPSDVQLESAVRYEQFMQHAILRPSDEDLSVLANTIDADDAAM